MNNSENKDIIDNTADDEASARAEKIKAIRESLRKASETPQLPAENVPEAATEAEPDVQAEEIPVVLTEEVPAEKAVDVPDGEVPAEEAVAANAAAMGIEEVKADEAEVPAGSEKQPVVEETVVTAQKPEKKKKGRKKKKKKPLKRRIRELFPEKGDSAAEIIRKIVFLISIIAIIVCGYMVADYYLDLWRSRMQYNNIQEIYEIYEPIEEVEISTEPASEGREEPEKIYTMLNGAKKLLGINPDTVGYIRIPSKDGSDPIVDLPVVKAHDNMKYLDRNFNGDDSRTGTLFLDFRNHFDEVEDGHLVTENSEHLVIYGHNMADESMFGKLKYYYGSAEYYTEHPIIQLNSNYESYKYKIFAVFIVDAKDESETKYDCWNKLELDSEEEFYDFVNEAKRRTIYTNDVDVKYGDGLLSLSTCHYLLKDRSRLMIMARTIRPGEDEYEGTEKSKKNKNIKWPSMYYNTKTNEKYDDKAIFIPYGPEEAVKEAEAKLAAQKKKKEEEKKKKEQASKEAEKAKITTTTKKSDSKKTTVRSTKTTVAKTAAVTKKTSAEE
ncbi:MAG: class B sortase [Ruminococcus sp.]|nr:class B sortase [Ruminococcus sp.]